LQLDYQVQKRLDHSPELQVDSKCMLGRNGFNILPFPQMMSQSKTHQALQRCKTNGWPQKMVQVQVAYFTQIANGRCM